ncbi:TonB-dependent receptor [Dyella nitratireducens]|uniref:TonB-dependent receptor n=1 Tax=Dyella nitratireducens TaxID=1849580 RepID=A0ABQ1FWR2_9GAMM|nr:TonB-dependent receptor [Dyella nitratireducens]GGA31846.1 TonB-dependent receptor [Dyella nitratireducens]GLQ42817.1 TonB-dependent receptor [Dyella nitratireducens]
MRPLLFGGIAVMSMPPPALAGESTAKAQTYTVTAGPLRNALDALAAQGDIQLVYDPALVAGKITHGVSGRLLPADALKQLLAGTGLSWKSINAATFVLEPVAALHQPSEAAAAKHAVVEQPKTLNTVTVSGSLISNADIQTATPTITITAADIRARGFNNLSDVLQNLVLATGSVQGPQAARTFTQGAQPVSLFGLGPQFTLILLDGKPVANFGRLYNGSINFASVANFPVGLIDHIDVMPGGASSIYGSQAIGGVINIVTKSHLDGGEISVRAGGYSNSGGANQRISGVYGHDFGKWRVLGALEFDSASPIWGYQRSLTANDSVPGLQAAVLDYGTAHTFTGNALGNLTPPNGCASQLFGGSTMPFPAQPPSPPGTYCGSRKVDGYTTYSNQLRNVDGMLKLAYKVSDHVRLYGDAMVNWQEQRWFPGVSDWATDDFPHQLVEDATTGHYLYFEKSFAPEEMPGGVVGQMDRQNDLLYQADIGANGRWGDSGWDWDIYYLRTGDRTEVVEPLWIKSKIDAVFGNMLGPLVGVDPQSGVNMYNPDYAAFFRPITPAQYASFARGVDEFSNTWINDTRATLSNASLFALPGGDAGFAVLAEGGSEAWYEPLNPLFTQGDIFEHAATGGGGQRFHAATAFELNLPLLKSLTLDLSGRYDYYSVDRSGDSRKFTYKMGVEYRPVDSLLLRANYTTSFKAPDLSSIFLGPTDFYTTATDYYFCAQAHSATCGTAYQYNIQGTTLANPKLQPTSAQSWTTGVVWSPMDGVDLSLDYLHIAIQNEVVQQDVDLLLRTDAQCLLGQLDATSAACRAALNQVQRQGSHGSIDSVTTYYANLANEVTKSILGNARYRFALFHLGMVTLQFDYNDMLHHTYQLAPGQAPINQLANALYSTEFKSITSGSITWTSPGGRWSSTVYGHRYGPSPNYVATNVGIGSLGAARVSPWITLNASATYHPTRNLALSLLINNLANKMPPNDMGYVQYPYFNDLNYNIYGREFMLQADLRLGRVGH